MDGTGTPVEVVACGEEEGMLPEFSAEQFDCDEDNGKDILSVLTPKVEKS